MNGVVLCGGESRRMGSDKGLLVKAGKTWAELAFSNLSGLRIKTAISVNRTQVELYSQIFAFGSLVTDNEILPVKGPLLGLLSVHQEFPAEDLLVVACDMINLKEEILQKSSDQDNVNKRYDMLISWITSRKDD